MPVIKPYSSMAISMINSTPNPAASVAIAASITMHRDPDYVPKPVSSSFCKRIIDAGHMSITEHVQMTFMCENISRSLLAQITRQRTAHPTSGSQHYQEYSNYPMMVSPKLFNEKDISELYIDDAFDACIHSYKTQIDNGVPKEEARQVLPNACGVNYLWTIDASNLFKFLTTRLCNRNVLEMRIFAERIKEQACAYFPEMFEHAFPTCISSSFCKEKDLGMQCKPKYYLNVNVTNPLVKNDQINTTNNYSKAEKFTTFETRTIGIADLISRIKVLQSNMGYDFNRMTLVDRMQFLTEYVCALNAEIGELLREVPWKPWRPIEDQKYADTETIANEFVDCLIFLINISFCVGLGTNDILDAFERVMTSNYERIENGTVYN